MPSVKTVALSATNSPDEGETGEELVACQYCKYLLEGAILGDCRIIRWIGSGAFGDVYEAEQLPPLNRRVAIKVMALERVIDGESAEMFAREVGTVAALDHPNILPVLRVGLIDDGRSYLVMKYAAQGSLQQFCQPAMPSFSSPSLLPTIMRPAIDKTPTGELAIVTAKTISIVEAIDTAATHNSLDSREDAETIRKEPQQQKNTDSETTSTDTSQTDDTLHADEPGTYQQMLLLAHKEDAAHQEMTLATDEETQVVAKPSQAETDASTNQPGTDEPVDAPIDSPSTSQAAQAEAGTSTNQPGTDEPVDAPIDSSSTSQSLQAETDASTNLPGTSEPVDAPVDNASTSQAAQAETDALLYTQDTQPAHKAGQTEGALPSAGVAIAVLDAPSTLKLATDAGAQEVEQIATLILTDEVQPQAIPLATPTSSTIEHLPPLSLKQVLAYVEEAAEALFYAHQRGLIHLDVKPANLLLDAQGRLMLADFGVSVLLEGYTHASLHYYVGTPLYTAPEQWLEQPRTASDQYALAVTCYQLLTGRPPFTGNLYAVMHGHLQGTPPPMSAFNPLVTTSIEMVILRALAKDPLERYPDILAFARALREAIENTASVDTTAQTMLLAEQRSLFVPQVRPPLTPVTTDNFAEETLTSHKRPPEPGTFRIGNTEPDLPGNQRKPAHVHWLRNLLLGILAVLLIAGGSLSFVRSQRPCWLGICPQILLSNHAITLTNNELQPINITNMGTDTLHWKASLHPLADWLSLSISSGTLAPGHSDKIILKTDVDSLKQSGVYTDMIDIDGGPGVTVQAIEVTENVVKGLSAVSVNTSGQTFLYEQGHLQPGKQKITITNQSGHTLNWFTQYTDNNWLAVTPSQGNLKDKQSINLTVTVENPQKLASDTYQVRFSLVGQLDNQADFTLLQTLDFSLQVNQSPTAQIVPTPQRPTPTVPPMALSFTAQPVAGTGAPAGQRANHSMIWDTQDNQLLVFGGSDAQGNLLNDLWSYSPTTNKWTNLTPANANTNASTCSGDGPAPRMNAAFVWDSVDHQALLYGGVGSNNSYLGDLWAYSPAKGSWNILACSGNSPGARGEAGAVWNGSQMLLLGGVGTSGTLADFWAYTPGTGGGWSEVSTTTPLAARSYPTMAWDGRDKQLYVFGGLSASGQQLNDFYAYQPGSGWNAIEASNGTAPMARQQALGTWDSQDGVFLLMGGWQASSNITYSALWAYSPTTNAWWQITSLNNNGIPSRMASVMVWDSTHKRAYIYAGSGGGNTATLNDLWMIVPG